MYVDDGIWHLGGLRETDRGGAFGRCCRLLTAYKEKRFRLCSRDCFVRMESQRILKTTAAGVVGVQRHLKPRPVFRCGATTYKYVSQAFSANITPSPSPCLRSPRAISTHLHRARRELTRLDTYYCLTRKGALGFHFTLKIGSKATEPGTSLPSTAPFHIRLFRPALTIFHSPSLLPFMSLSNIRRHSPWHIVFCASAFSPSFSNTLRNQSLRDSFRAMAAHRDELIDRAIKDVRNGLSQRAAAAKHGICQPTLSRRIHGNQSHRESKALTQRLSPAQESFICNWIVDEEEAGRPPNRRQVAEFATSLLENEGDHDKLGLSWMDRFLRRHPEIRTFLSGTRGTALDDSDGMVNDSTLIPSPATIPPSTPSRVEGSEDAFIFNTPKTGKGLLDAIQDKPPKTPPRAEGSEDASIFNTGRDLMEAIKDMLPKMDPDVAIMFIKAAKAIDIKNAQLTALDHQIQYYKARWEFTRAREASEHAPKRRKVN